jgi:predicted NBD/HSP70 family sugar kinase
MSRAEISRRIALTKVTVSDLVEELLIRGHLVELGLTAATRPGKPATLLDINRGGLQLLGVDLTGPDVMRAALLDVEGGVVSLRERRLRPEERGHGLFPLLVTLIEETRELATCPVLGVGVGTSGVVGPDGVVLKASNLGWADFPLGTLLADAIGLPVLITNDADAAAHAEHMLGAGGDDLLLVKVGRGVGCGVVIDGRRLQGSHHAAGEIGHVSSGDMRSERCSCGRRGCLETWLSVPRLEQAIASDPPAAEATLRAAGGRLAAALAPAVAVLDPSVVAVCGPAELIQGHLLHAFEATLRTRLLSRTAWNLEVRWVDDRDIVMRGAAVLVLGDQWGVA